MAHTVHDTHDAGAFGARVHENGVAAAFGGGHTVFHGCHMCHVLYAPRIISLSENLYLLIFDPFLIFLFLVRFMFSIFVFSFIAAKRLYS